MENLNECITVLQNGLLLLALPFDNTPKTIVDSNGKLYSITRKSGEISFILPVSDRKFSYVLEAYNRECCALIEKCKKLHFELSLQNTPLDIMESYAKLREVRVLDPAMFVLFWKKNKVFVKCMKNPEIESKYLDFILNWHDLHRIVFQKKNELFKGVDKHFNSNGGMIEDDANSEMLGSNEDELLVFPKKFSIDSAEKIYSKLLGRFINDSTTVRDFLCIFSLSDYKGKFKPVKWIKKNSGVANGKVNKLSLIDLLTLLGYTQREIIGESGMKYKRLNNCFAIESSAFKAKDFTIEMKKNGEDAFLNVESEFHKELVELLVGINLPCGRDE